MNQPLPWTLNQILRDLETANMITLHKSSTSHNISLANPSVFASFGNTLPPPEAYNILNP